VTALPWVLVAIESLILTAAIVIWLRRAGRTVDAILAEIPPPPVTGEQVKALTQVFVAVLRDSEYGGRLDEFATAALVWMSQQQRGGTS